MAHNHWPVGPEPQLYLTSVCYSWCQSDGRGCPTRSEQWGHAYRYGSGAHAEYSTGSAVIDLRWVGGRYKDGGQHPSSRQRLRSAREVAGEFGGRDHQQRLDDLWENQQLPTREAVARQFTDKTSEEQQVLLARAMQQWQSENTRLYFLVKDSVAGDEARWSSAKNQIDEQNSSAADVPTFTRRSP